MKRIALAPRVFFFLDYDGTLTPIMSKPGKAVLKKAMRDLLHRLSTFQGLKVAVVSGRSLSNLQRVVGSNPGIIYVGNHGLEIKGQDFSWNHSSVSRYAKIMKRIWGKLRRSLCPVNGMLLENKTLGISLHYRLVPEAMIAGLYRNFYKILIPWIQSGLIRVREGKKVWEVRPHTRLWNKGRAVQWLLKRYKRRADFLTVFLGDDQTDEDVFRVLAKRGITVKVTGNPREHSAANYYIHSPQRVHEFLDRVVKIRTGNKIIKQFLE